MANSGKLIVFSAPSGSGKTTLVRYLLQQAELDLDFSISATSRQARGEETHGKDYYFLTADDFKNHVNRDEFLEYEEVYKDNFYGTLKSELYRIWQQGKHVIFDIDVIGGLNIKRQFPEQTLAIFVKPPSKEILEQRLRSRQTETEEKIQMRLAKAEQELSKAALFDVVIENDDLEIAKKEVYQLVSAFIRQS